MPGYSGRPLHRHRARVREHRTLGAHAVAVLKEALSAKTRSNETALHELGFCSRDHWQTRGFKVEAIAKRSIDFVNRHPYSCPGWYNLGNALAAHPDSSHRAIEAYEYALVIDERLQSRLCCRRRAALTMVEDYQERALECYRESMLMDAPQANTLHPDGGVQGADGESSRTRHQTTTTAPWSLDGEFADAHVGLGVVAEMREDWTGKPAMHFEKAMELEPGQRGIPHAAGRHPAAKSACTMRRALIYIQRPATGTRKPRGVHGGELPICRNG